MLSILNVIAPIFALMALGYGAVRLRLFPAEGIRSLISFVNNFATPCLLFHSIVGSDFRSAFNLAIIGPFYIGALICFALGIFVAIKFFGNQPGEGVSVGFSGTFTNTVLVGLPIMQRAYGPDALPVTLSIIGLHGAILLTAGMLVMELVRRDGAPVHGSAARGGKGRRRDRGTGVARGPRRGPATGACLSPVFTRSRGGA